MLAEKKSASISEKEISVNQREKNISQELLITGKIPN
jgi:hypothetical protein